MFCQSVYQGSSSGEIQLIVGPMFSGKSTELIRRIRRYEIAQKRVLVVNHNSDKRYNNGKSVISSHDLEQVQAIMAPTITDIMGMTDNLTNYDVVAIDEGQFFPDVDVMAEKLANLGKIVIVAALDGTYARKPFGCISNLISKADSVIKLLAVCYCCAAPAPFSARLSSETAEIVVAGQDKYVAVCRKCWNAIEQEKNKKREEEEECLTELQNTDKSQALFQNTDTEKVTTAVQMVGDTDSSSDSIENYFELEKQLKPVPVFAN